MEKGVVIRNKCGLHTRPSSLVANTASKFREDVWIKKEGVEGWLNAKSVLGIISLEGYFGDKVIISSEKEEAVFAIIKLFEDKFGEE
ncbi:HPr family phosphocarrier protein [bacterium]|nr:HPr family phosphocarrier protein [bacterium]